MEQLNFGESEVAASKINGWVENITRNKIKDLVSAGDFDELTRLVLVNAIYFKGLWKNKFDVRVTTKAPFHLNSKDSVEVDMMKQDADFPYADISDLSAKAIALPYLVSLSFSL